MAPESFPFLPENDKLLLRRVSSTEAGEMCLIRDVFKRAASAIAKWPDFSFETADGRRFLLFYEGISIRHRLEAAEGCLTGEEIACLDSCWAIIHEAGSPDQPMVFHSGDEEATDAWLDLHRLYREPLAREEIDFFGVDNETLFDSD